MVDLVGAELLILGKGSDPKRPNWSLPKRDIAGITPKGWVQVRNDFAALRDSIQRGG